MKNHLLISLAFTGFVTLSTKAQVIIDTVSVGAQYADQKWYSLQNDEQATQSKDNWDIAFEITGYASAILGNSQKTNFAVYKAPFAIADYSSMDTAGINLWPVLNNSDTSWAVGAFNKGANLSNPNDLGWGVYDMNTHFVNGDSCYVIKLSATSYKKIKIVSLASGSYNFEYANIDGSASQIVSISKSTYAGKNFVYYNLSTNTTVDREPLSSAWDFTFVKYTAFVPPAGTPYGVTGVLHNKGVTVAQADNAGSPASYTNYAAHTFKSAINEIGYDWKEINMGTFLWDIKTDTVYFVKDKPGNIWKVRFTKFTGSTTGSFIFSKEKLAVTTVGIDEAGEVVSQVVVYPNPSQGSGTHLLFSNKKVQIISVSVLDMNGRIISTELFESPEGLTTHFLDTRNLRTGMYFVKLSTENYSSTSKLVIQ